MLVYKEWYVIKRQEGEDATQKDLFTKLKGDLSKHMRRLETKQPLTAV